MLILKKRQALVEFVFIVSFLLLLVFGIYETGRIVNNFIRIKEATMYSARQGAIHGLENEKIVEAFLYNVQGMIDENNVSFVGETTNNGEYDLPAAVYEENFNGTNRLTLEIAPGDVNKRINGSWVMVKATYNHKIIMPLFASILNRTGLLVNGDQLPLTRYTIYRIE